MTASWAICDECHAWGLTPLGFDERRHILTCTKCGNPGHPHRTGAASEYGIRLTTTFNLKGHDV